MDPVKITDTKEWSSIDIFLFSNGQQYSPPRKYHLRSEELQWWEATVSYLGRTHYGSGHSSIELYTLDGSKVNGPLELINGAAFVAVEPPDSFINTGYEEYLLRATRSWEKRLAQKTYNNEISNPDLTRDKVSDVLNDIDVVIHDIPENIADTASTKEKKYVVTSPLKTQLNKPQQRLQRKSITGSKQIQKKKSFDTHTAMLKKMCAEKDKALFPCPKKSTQKKNECVNRKASAVVPRTIDNNQKQLSFCKNGGSVTTEHNEQYKKQSIESEKTHSLLPSIDESNPKPVVDNEQIVIDLYNNKHNELTSLKDDSERYSTIDKAVHLKQSTLNNNYILGQDEYVHGHQTNNNIAVKQYSTSKLNQINKDKVNDIFLNDGLLKSDVERVSPEKNSKTTDYKENNSYNDDTLLNSKSISEKQVTNEYVAYMNKGGILLLKFKIKLKDCKAIFNRDKSKTIPTSTSSNELVTEKISQVDMNIKFSGELLKEEQCTRDKSLQSIINKLYAEKTDHMRDKNPKIVILQCACRDYSDNQMPCMCEREDEDQDRKCETTFCNQLQNETSTSCLCHNQLLNIPNNDNSFKKCLCSEKEERNDAPSISYGKGMRVKDLAQKFEVSDRTTNEEIGNKFNINNTSMNDNPKDTLILTRVNDLPMGNDFENRKGNCNTKSVCDKSTQTDWSNILLEARGHEDDSYSFHLPSLYILKQCNI